MQEAIHFRAWQLEQADIRKQQRAEGKVFYREFTDEEKKEREEEAHRAWEEEQARLQKGVDKMKERSRDDADSGWTRQKYADGEEEIDLPVSIADNNRVEEVTAVEKSETIIKEDEGHQDEEVTFQGDTVRAEEEMDDVLEGLLNKAREQERKEEAERQERVSASMAIYMKQKEEKANKENRSISSSIQGIPSSSLNEPSCGNDTWQSALTSPEKKPTPYRVTLFWTVEMDLKLSNLVKECSFDFDKVFLKMISAASDGLLGELNKASIALISSEACRLRWCELDASQWAELSSEERMQEVIHKVCVDAEDIGSNGRGVQLTFDQLKAKANNGTMPRYLSPPTIFPSVPDDDDEEGDDGEKEEAGEEEAGVDIRSISLRMKRYD